VVDGYRESTQSWRELLGQLKRLGLAAAPKLAIGDGSLGFWIALQEEYGPVVQQRCWVHKTANILDKMPKSGSDPQSSSGSLRPVHLQLPSQIPKSLPMLGKR
jgi:transposase-like protein